MGCTAYQIRESGSALIHQWNAADGDDFVASRQQLSRDVARWFRTRPNRRRTSRKFKEKFARKIKEYFYLEKNI